MGEQKPSLGFRSHVFKTCRPIQYQRIFTGGRSTAGLFMCPTIGRVRHREPDPRLELGIHVSAFSNRQIWRPEDPGITLIRHLAGTQLFHHQVLFGPYLFGSRAPSMAFCKFQPMRLFTREPNSLFPDLRQPRSHRPPTQGSLRESGHFGAPVAHGRILELQNRFVVAHDLHVLKGVGAAGRSEDANNVVFHSASNLTGL